MNASVISASGLPWKRKQRQADTWIPDLNRGLLHFVTVMFELKTDRLRLRQWRKDDRSDVDGLFAILSDPETLKLWPFLFDRDGVETWISNAVASYDANGFGRWAVEVQDTGVLIGDCGLNSTAIGDWSYIDLGWILHAPHHGNGYAIEAARAIVDHAFNTLNLRELIAHMADDHLASKAVAEKLGMTFSHAQPYERNLNKRHLFYKIQNT